MSEENAVNRRRLLRRAGTVAAGLGAAGVASAVAATPASAAAGDPVLLKPDNDGGVNTTGITSTNATSTLALANPGGGSALVLVPGAFASAPADGALGFDDQNYLLYGWTYNNGVDPAMPGLTATVYDDSWANLTIPLFTPQRVLDTRYLDQRAMVLNPTALQADGRIKAGMTIYVKLGAVTGDQKGYMLSTGAQALHGNLTITQPVSGGYASIFPYGAPMPSTSNVNYVANQTIPNAVFTAIGTTDAGVDVVSIFSQRATHAILDVAAVVAAGYSNVYSNFLAMAAGGASIKAGSTRTPRGATPKKIN